MKHCFTIFYQFTRMGHQHKHGREDEHYAQHSLECEYLSKYQYSYKHSGHRLQCAEYRHRHRSDELHGHSHGEYRHNGGKHRQACGTHKSPIGVIGMD